MFNNYENNLHKQNWLNLYMVFLFTGICNPRVLKLRICNPL